MSLGYLKDEGYVISSDFSRINARVKVDQKLGKNFKAGMNIAYAKTTSNSPVDLTGSTTYSNIFNFSQNNKQIYVNFHLSNI